MTEALYWGRRHAGTRASSTGRTTAADSGQPGSSSAVTDALGTS